MLKRILATLSLLSPPVLASGIIDELLVTAQKRPQQLQDVSIAAQIFRASDVEALKLEEPSDLSQHVPNLQIRNTLGANPSFTIRGVGIDDYSPLANTTVGLYVDEVYLSSTSLMDLQLHDVERIEVLKGPQGTLYGRNSPAGAINFISKKPTSESDYRIKVGVANDERYEVQLLANGKLNDKLYARLSVSSLQQRGGYQHNYLNGETLGDKERSSYRAALNWQPNDQLEIYANLHGSRQKQDGPSFQATGLVNGADLLGFQDQDGNNYAGHYSNNSLLDGNSRGGVVTINWQAAEYTLVSVTGYEDFSRKEQGDSDGGPYRQSDYSSATNIQQWSQEFRLSNDTEESWQWMLGAFFSEDDITNHYDIDGSDLFLTIGSADAIQKAKSRALFFDTTWQLSDTWSISLGGRYSEDRKHFVGGSHDNNPYGFSLLLNSPTNIDFTTLSFIDPSQAITTVQPLAGIDRKISDENTMSKISLSFQPDKQTHYFFKISEGYKAGGFNGQLAFSNHELEPFAHEQLLSYELGSKQQLLDGRLQINTAIFHYDYRDLQLVSSKTITAPGGSQLTVVSINNAANASITGIENDIGYSISPQLDIHWGLALLEGKIRDYRVDPANPNDADLSGNKFSDQPKWSSNLRLRYQWQLTEQDEVSLQGSISCRDKVFLTANNKPALQQASYCLLDSRATYQSKDQRWQFALWGKNLADKQYRTMGFDLSKLGWLYSAYGPRRTWGIEAEYSF